jgi:hypothetical protein
MIVVYDIETLKSLFTMTAYDLKTGEIQSFVIHKLRNDYKAMLEYIGKLEGMIGFNNVDFDYAVLDPFLYESEEYLEMDGDALAKKIYKRAQKVLSEDFRKDYDKPVVPQRDLYRIWHFNNKARATSLKFLQINMGWKNAQEMPVKHDAVIKTEAEIQQVLDYNLNDVLSTVEFYKLTKDKIRMRKTLGEKYGIDFGNASDTKIGEQIFLHEMSKKTRIPVDTLKEGRTFRKNIALGQVIIDSISFSSKGFQEVLDKFKKMVISNTRKSEDISVMFDGMKYEFGFGGLHAVREPGLYKNITSADVKSYYPNLAISYRFYPKHLSEAFCDVYKQLYDERGNYSKGSDESNAIKLALNGVYGMSNAEWSPFYDPFYTMCITINGQLLLALLCEKITLSGAGTVIMANTDGIEVDVRDSERFYEICGEWQNMTRLQLELSQYTTLAIRDVNNYTGMKVNGEIKEKGDYVCDREIYKDQSMKIVTSAVRDFFHKGIPVEHTISDCKDISMFVMGKRAKTGNLEYRRVDGQNLAIDTLPKNVRYYVSHTGGSIVKALSNNRTVNLHVGHRQTLFNKWVDKPFEEYGVYLPFYITEARKLIDAVLKNQLQLF